MTTLNIHDAKTHLSRLLERVRHRGQLSDRARDLIAAADTVVAQAQLEGLPIATADPAIGRYDVETIW